VYFVQEIIMSPEESIERFKLLGLSEQKAKETLKNSNVTKFLLEAINEVIIYLKFFLKFI
jgi:hypothetical protein